MVRALLISSNNTVTSHLSTCRPLQKKSSQQTHISSFLTLSCQPHARRSRFPNDHDAGTTSKLKHGSHSALPSSLSHTGSLTVPLFSDLFSDYPKALLNFVPVFWHWQVGEFSRLETQLKPRSAATCALFWRPARFTGLSPFSFSTSSYFKFVRKLV